ncbi:MAPEG family protein [Pseudoalteromonas aurantia]|uniref:MAPEG family protein n=1 Tax=Pseudoalteromonas aurantia 208 TaxID=1314867 RepID=A0ABR9EAU3_9GAMM|nr:MAPEG family protein [Pseudoalteromonas aurantia]MBE0368112.1 hypothetical protein [Pseudoalteromonas aurantia 208]
MWIQYPLFFLLILIAFLWILTTVLRVRAYITQSVSPADITFINKHNLSKLTVLAGNNYDNQFQQPVLFTILLITLQLHQLDGHLWYVISCFFVVARYWHCAEHIMGRNLLLRTIAFAMSSLTLFIGWFCFIYRMYTQ